MISAKVVLSLLCCFSAISVFIFRLDRKGNYFQFSVGVTLAFLVIRGALFIWIFLLLGLQAQSDVVVYYNWAHNIATDQTTGARYSPPLIYGPLFLYVVRLVTTIWPDPKAFVCFTILCELGLFVCWLALMYSTSQAALTARRSAVLYTFCPLSVFTAALLGNNDVVVGAVGAVIWLFGFRKLSVSSGLAAAFAILASKALAIIVAVPPFLNDRRKILWGLAAAIPVLGVYGVWLYASDSPLTGLRFHALDTSSGNLPFLLGLLFGYDFSEGPGRQLANLVGLACVLATFGLPFLQRKSYRPSDVVPITAAATLTFLIVSGKAFTHYALIALFPILFIVAEQQLLRMLVLYSVFSVAATVESSFWFRWFQNMPPYLVRARFADGNPYQVAIFCTVECVLLLAYGIILWWAVGRYFPGRRSAATIRY